MIVLENIKKEYKSSGVKTEVLKGINLSIKNGEFIMIIGKSGCGKSTLLNIIGAMDSASAGQYIFNNENILTLSKDKLSSFRRDNISFIFQAFNLIPELNVLENVAMPLGYQGIGKSERNKKALSALKKVGMDSMAKKAPNKLSGGEKQRVAIARAIVDENQLILADEPTGNLDEKNSLDIIKLLEELNKSGATIVMVTHDMELIKYASRVLFIENGVIKEA